MCVLFSVSGAHDSRSTRNTLNAASVSYVAEDWEEKKRPDIKEKEKKKSAWNQIRKNMQRGVGGACQGQRDPNQDITPEATEKV